MTASESQLLRMPPQNLDAEQSILGAVMLENDSIDLAIPIVQPDDFYREAHRKIYIAMMELAGRGEAIDLITVPDVLRKRDELEKVGGLSYISSLLGAVPNSANIRYHCNIVKEKSMLRQVITGCTGLITEAYEGADADHVISRAGEVLYAVSERHVRNGLIGPKQYTEEAWNSMEAAHDRKKPLTGLSTGLTELDAMTGGLQPGDLIIVAGRPSMGKTAIAVNNLAYTAAFMDKTPVNIYSLEMSRIQLVQRLLCSTGQVDSWKARNGLLNPAEWNFISTAAGKLAAGDLYIDDNSTRSPTDIMVSSRAFKRRHGLGLIVIDHLGFMRSGKKHEKRFEEVGNITKACKGIAKQLNVPVVLLCQLNRGLESRPDKTPMMTDLRESGDIEQDADVIMFLYREEYYKKCTCDKDGDCFCGRRGKAKLIVAKQRNGPTGEIDLLWQPRYAVFTDKAGVN